jgi:hypothetical protein
MCILQTPLLSYISPRTLADYICYLKKFMSTL